MRCNRSIKVYTKTGYWIKQGDVIWGTCELEELPEDILEEVNKDLHIYTVAGITNWFNYENMDYFYATKIVRECKDSTAVTDPCWKFS